MTATEAAARDLAVSGTQVEGADIAASKHLGRYRDTLLVRALGSASEIADQAPLFSLCTATIAAGVLARRPRVAATGAGMLASALLATALKGAVKKLVSRTRPHLLLDSGHYDVQALGPDAGNWHSFPSGHTAGAVAVARAVARGVPEAAAPAYATAAAIAVVQVPRGTHFPIDVVAGAAIGIVAEALVEYGTGQALGWLERRS